MFGPRRWRHVQHILVEGAGRDEQNQACHLLVHIAHDTAHVLPSHLAVQSILQLVIDRRQEDRFDQRKETSTCHVLL